VPVYEPRWTTWAGAYGGSNRTTGDLAVIGSHDLSARTVGGAAICSTTYVDDAEKFRLRGALRGSNASKSRPSMAFSLQSRLPSEKHFGSTSFVLGKIWRGPSMADALDQNGKR
jgi:hypothetical protein